MPGPAVACSCILPPLGSRVASNFRNGERRIPVAGTDPIKIILAILLPSVGTFLEIGLRGHFWLNILLTVLGYVPGSVHALYAMLKH